MRHIELLSPAADKATAIEAIRHGADAVYIGAASHGARHRAANSTEDIREVVEFAHRFRARVYVTVNTLVYENELQQVHDLVWNLWRIGVDALIVQDMSLLRMDLPPIALHASTQCDTRSAAKARFLEEAGFSQIVLARELSADTIRQICEAVKVPVECFVHGALCVSYSGRCSASQVAVGRSANRGECAQMCRMPYTLRNSRGEILEKDKYLLSLRDFNATNRLEEMIEAGVTSFKIEGRLKETGYVKNITAWYRRKIDEIIARNPDRYCRASAGSVELSFEPDPRKSFNRGFTEYFLGGRRSNGQTMASLLTPKSQGERIDSPELLHNGDGICWVNAAGEFEGMNVNGVDRGRIIGSRRVTIPRGVELRRTFDVEWNKKMASDTAVRTIRVDMEIDAAGLSLSDERGVQVRVSLDAPIEKARTPQDLIKVLGKTGNTIYRLRNLTDRLPEGSYIPASALAQLRRRGLEALDICSETTYRRDMRRSENRDYPYPDETLEARDNVANSLARRFYADHGAKVGSPAVECGGKDREREVMTTRYCILRELGACRREVTDPNIRRRFSEPLEITTGPHRFRLKFHCDRCEMGVCQM